MQASKVIDYLKLNQHINYKFSPWTFKFVSKKFNFKIYLTGLWIFSFISNKSLNFKEMTTKSLNAQVADI